MKVTFFSNFLNHHQLPFCLEMYRVLGENFKFVATEAIHEERLAMGYSDMNNIYPFTLNTYQSNENFEEGINLGNSSDIVIIGSAPDIFIKGRMVHNKLTFRYNERVFKKGLWRILSPRTLFSLYRNHTIYKSKKMYMLCASAYTAIDYNLVGAYRGKTYKWGYFPDAKQHDLDRLFTSKRDSIPKLLWVGRFIDWKQPEHAVYMAKRLKELGYKFTLDIIGTGPLENKLNNLIDKYNLTNNVKLLGSMSPKQVREHMESANIYLFTSDFNEGWGAVLNESMNSGCAVVASHAIGSVPFLINHEVNGLVYKNGDLDNLLTCIKRLLDNKKFCEEMGRAAYNTITEDWNAAVATERFLTLAKRLLDNKETIYKDGPCSKAPILSERYRD